MPPTPSSARAIAAETLFLSLRVRSLFYQRDDDSKEDDHRLPKLLGISSVKWACSKGLKKSAAAPGNQTGAKWQELGFLRITNSPNGQAFFTLGSQMAERLLATRKVGQPGLSRSSPVLPPRLG
jgi:hypothetical protein